MLDRILLGMLHDPLSGYDLKRSFDRSAAYFWSADQSQIYRTLKRMVGDGWLRTSEEPSPEGPRRVLYHRTAAGRAALEAWLAESPDLAPQRLPYVAQLHFHGELGDLATTRAWLDELDAELAARLAALKALDASADPQDLAAFHASLTLSLGVAAARARLDWCRAAKRRVTRALRTPARSRP